MFENAQIDGLALAMTGLLACAVAYAIVTLAKQLSEAIVGGISHYAKKVPIIGGFLAAPFDWLYHKINNVLTPVLVGLEGNLGWYWNELGNLFASLGNEILGLATWVANLEDYLYGVVKPFVIHTVLDGLKHGAKWLRAELAHLKAKVYHVATVIEHPLTGPIAAGVKAGTRVITAKIAAAQRWITHTGAWLYHAVAVELPHTIAGLRARDLSLSRLYSRLRKIVARHERLLGVSAITGLVVWALSRVGAGWVFCRNWNRVGRAVCRTPFGDIEALLGLFVTGVVIADFRELVKLAQKVEHETAVVIQDIAKV